MSVMRSLALSAIARGVNAPENAVTRFLELQHLRKLLALLRVNCVLDVGANQGQFATELRRIGYRGRLVSFEPVASVYQGLAEHFRGDAEWRGYALALGSKDETATIHVQPSLTVMSSLRAPRRVRPDKLHEEQIQVRRLDGLIEEIVKDIAEPRLFLKMDTQGFDLEVFRGAGRALAWVRGLQSELSVVPIYDDMPHYLEALSAYEQAGFTLYDLTVVNRTEEGGLLELNCFMQRPEASA